MGIARMVVYSALCVSDGVAAALTRGSIRECSLWGRITMLWHGDNQEWGTAVLVIIRSTSLDRALHRKILLQHIRMCTSSCVWWC